MHIQKQILKSLQRLTALDDGDVSLAASAAAFEGDLDLSNLKKMTTCCAERLAEHRGTLGLDGITSLSESAARAFARKQGAISLGGITSLSASRGHLLLAEKLAEQDSHLCLNGLRTLPESVAGAIAFFRGHSLSLLGLRVISQRAARALSRCESHLNLGGLKALPATLGHLALARRLASGSDHLALNGLRSLSAPVAREIAKHPGVLSLDRLSCLTAAVGRALGQSVCSWIMLCSLKSLSPAAASELTQFEGEALFFSSLTFLSEPAAKALGELNCELSLPALESLSANAAQALANHSGELHLNGLRMLSSAAARALANHEGPLYLPKKILQADLAGHRALKLNPYLHPC